MDDQLLDAVHGAALAGGAGQALPGIRNQGVTPTLILTLTQTVTLSLSLTVTLTLTLTKV